MCCCAWCVIRFIPGVYHTRFSAPIASCFAKLEAIVKSARFEMMIDGIILINMVSIVVKLALEDQGYERSETTSIFDWVFFGV